MKKFLLIALCLLLVTGCTKTQWPFGESKNRHAFASTHATPITVLVVDTYTGEELVNVDVPIGNELIVDFDPDNFTYHQGPAPPPSKVSWQIVHPNDWITPGFLDNQLPLPGNPVRVEVKIRELVDVDPEVPTAPPVQIVLPEETEETEQPEPPDQTSPTTQPAATTQVRPPVKVTEQPVTEQPATQPDTSDLEGALE